MILNINSITFIFLNRIIQELDNYFNELQIMRNLVESATTIASEKAKDAVNMLTNTKQSN